MDISSVSKVIGIAGAVLLVCLISSDCGWLLGLCVASLRLVGAGSALIVFWHWSGKTSADTNILYVLLLALSAASFSAAGAL